MKRVLKGSSSPDIEDPASGKCAIIGSDVLCNYRAAGATMLDRASYVTYFRNVCAYIRLAYCSVKYTPIVCSDALHVESTGY